MTGATALLTADDGPTTTGGLVPAVGAGPTGDLVRLPTESVDPSPTNPRKTFPARELRELRASIEARGLLQPITARPVQTEDGVRYEAVLGGRRLRAHGPFDADAYGPALPALDDVLAIVRELSDEEALEAQLIENLQREGVPPVEEAAGFRRLLDTGRSVAEVARIVGKPDTHVRTRAQLLHLVPAAAEAVDAGRLPLGVASQLARLGPDDQAAVFTWWTQCAGQAGEGPTAAVVASHIRHQVMRLLRNATFDTRDPALVAGRPACPECPQRTGYSQSLFPDVDEADTCTLPACYAAKTAAHVERVVLVQRAKADRAAKTTAKGKAPGKPTGAEGAPAEAAPTTRAVVTLSTRYTPQDRAPGALGPEDYRTLGPKEACDHSAAGVWADGHEAGKVTRVCVRGSGCPAHYPRGQKLDAHAAQEREKAKAIKTERAVLGRTLAATVAALPVHEGTDPATGAPVTGVALDTLRLIAASMAGRLWSEYQKHVAKAHGWEAKDSRWEPADGAVFGRYLYGYGAAIAEAIGTMEAPALYRLMAFMALTEDAWPGPNSPTSWEPTRLLALAAEVGVDADAIRAEVTAR